MDHTSMSLFEFPNVVENTCTLLMNRWMAPSPRFPATTAAGGEASAQRFISYSYHPEYFESADPFECAALYRVPLPQYVDRVFRYMTGSDVDCLLGAIRLIDRYHLETGCTIGLHNAHLVFFVALMVATKCLSDIAHRVDYYARVAAMSRHQLTQLELIMSFECRWDILPQPSELERYAAILERAGIASLCDAEAPLPGACFANDSLASEETAGISVTSDADIGVTSLTSSLGCLSTSD